MSSTQQQYKSIRGHEPLRVPEGWNGQSRALVVQLEHVLDDIYRRFGRLRMEDLSEELRALLTGYGNNIEALQDAVDEAEGDIDDLEEAVGAAEEDIDALENSVSGVTNELHALYGLTVAQLKAKTSS